MTKHEKLIQKFLKNPSSLRFSQIEKTLSMAGFMEINVKSGSHRKFKHVLLQNDLIIPVHNNDCKDFYKKQAAKCLLSILKSIDT